MRSNKELFILLAILCLGLFLRIYDLGGESMWLDESVSLRLAHKGLSAIIKNRAANIHPPFYFLLLHYWVALLGDSEFVSRFLSVLFGVASMFMIYKVGSLFFDKEVGLLSSLLLATSRFHIQYSQEARAYALMALLTLLSIYFFKRLFEERNPWDSIGYILSTVLLAYTHVFGLFIPIVENLYFFTLFLFPREDTKLPIKRWFLLQFSFLLLFAPWIPVLFNQVFRFQGGFRREVPSMEMLFSTFGRFAGSEGLVVLLMALAFLSLVGWKKGKGGGDGKGLSKFPEGPRQRVIFTDMKDIYLLLLWLFIPIILPFLISKFSAPIYKYRCVIGASLALYLLAAKGIRSLAFAPAKLIAAGTITAFSLMAVWGYYGEVQKEQWREAASYMDSNAKPEDLILFNAGYSQRPFNYYSKRPDLIKQSFPSGIIKSDRKAMEELSSLTKGYGRIWLILSHSHDYRGLSVEALGRIYRLAHQRDFKGIRIYLFEGSGGSKSRSPSKRAIESYDQQETPDL